MGRVAERSGFPIDARLALLEGDADHQEAEMLNVHSELRAINKTLMGVFVALATAAVLLAINVAVGAMAG